VAITGRRRAGLSIGVTGVRLIATGALVLAVVVASEYHLYDS
jgi:hypothetical protein